MIQISYVSCNDAGYNGDDDDPQDPLVRIDRGLSVIFRVCKDLGDEEEPLELGCFQSQIVHLGFGNPGGSIGSVSQDGKARVTMMRIIVEPQKFVNGGHYMIEFFSDLICQGEDIPEGLLVMEDVDRAVAKKTQRA